MRAPLTCGVRLLVAFNRQCAEALAIDASVVCSFLGVAFFGTHALRILARPSAKKRGGFSPGGAASLSLAVCPSAACLPPCSAKVPHAIACWLPVLRQSAHGHQFGGAAGIKCQTKQADRLLAMRMRQNLCTPHNGSSGMPPSSIQQPSKFGLFSLALPSLPSLTLRSRGRRHIPSLRASHAGAPYLWR